MFPLEGTLGDYVDLTLITNPWQMWVVLGLIFALLIWPQMSARQSVKRIEKSMTQNNGGASMKDYLDRNEAANGDLKKTLDDHLVASKVQWAESNARLDKLETKRRWFIRRPSSSESSARVPGARFP